MPKKTLKQFLNPYETEWVTIWDLAYWYFFKKRIIVNITFIGGD